MVVQHNIPALNANRLFGVNNSGLAKSLEKLSSGYAINRAGDNAAGLAVSEKMRAQISGLTQASKNASDGISMIQTFEGALQETDSILQRMRTLAVQSANGTYQDDVDREAIQLEFDQLNDELNQIADTDFNGVVVLNGGKMADGLQATASGETKVFDYANKEAQTIELAKSTLAADKEAAAKAFNNAYNKFASTNYDLSANGSATEWNTVDSNQYTTTQADKLWDTLGITDTGAAGGNVKTDKINEVSITFKMKADGTWAADSAVANDGTKWDSAKLTGVTAAKSDLGAGNTNATGDGGFTVSAGGTALNVNAIFDATEAKAGDTVTLTFKNGKPSIYAPNNIGFDEKSIKADSGNNTITKSTVTAAIDTGLDDDAMTENINNALKALENVKVNVKYDDTAGFAAGDVTLTDDSGVAIEIGSADNTNGITKTINGVEMTIKADTDTAANVKKYTISVDGVDLMSINTGTDDATATTGNNGTFEGVISISASNYSESSSVLATVGKNDSLGTSAENKSAVDATKAALDKLNATDITDFESAKAYLNEKGVSVSDSYDQSTATLTYTDNITLQTGARTKDSVNFTFKYESKGLGELDPDLDCSARGLGTDKLSLATQKDANKAIDKIDNAINKVSMVRASFGAMQNRLEHKIANLDTNNENLTAAESRIRDTDMAKEMTNFTKNQILSQASQAMLAQANQLPQGVLQLLG